MIRLQFVMGTDFASRVIAWFGGGEFSHVDAITTTGDLLGARSDRIEGFAPGVQIRDRHYMHSNIIMKFSVPSTAAQEDIFLKFLMSQIGKPYDKKAIWGFILGRDWRNKDSWICSEIIAAALEECGVFHTLYLSTNRISPNALALAVSAVGQRIS